MGEPIIRLREVSKAYRAGRASTQVLRDVSLEVEAGEFLAIVGTSGSGKSTLLNIMGGLDTQYTGHVEVAGRDLSRLGDRELSAFRNATIGFVFQQFNLLEHLSCAENVAMPAIFGDHSDEEAAQHAARALERVGLGDRLGDLAANLSGGQKQRVAIARALFNRPAILLCDEPTGNLDSNTGRQVIELFKSLNGDGITMLIVTHEARVSTVAHRILRLEDGVLGADGADGADGDNAPVGVDSVSDSKKEGTE
jgi:ABC-type lipoprotein export system ATPase subunit